MYLFFDTETTGLPINRYSPVSDLNNWPRLVQLAWIKCDNSGKQTSSANYIIKPHGFTIPQDSTEIHGISHERAISEGIDLERVLDEFSKIINESRLLVSGY